MKYETPIMEIIRFQQCNSILTASPVVTESPLEPNTETLPEYDPFA